MKRKKIGLLLITGVLFILLTACSKKSNMYESDSNFDVNQSGTASRTEYVKAGGNYGTSFEAKVSETTAAASDAGDSKAKDLTSTSVLTSSGPQTNPNDKIIRRVNMQVETQEFDNLIKTIDSKIGQLGGYVENSNISGRNYYSDNMRQGNIVARIPKDKLNSFINTVNDIANVTMKEETTENVTLQYTDVESHKKALQIEQERLLVLLDKATKIEDIITLESRLSDIRYQLQNFETQLRTYDNQVEYSTVTLNIQEVERMSAVSEEKKTMWSRIENGFGETVYNISEGFKNFVVWFAVNFLYLLIWAVVIIIIVIFSRRFLGIKKVKNKMQNEEENEKPKKDKLKVKENREFNNDNEDNNKID